MKITDLKTETLKVYVGEYTRGFNGGYGLQPADLIPMDKITLTKFGDYFHRCCGTKLNTKKRSVRFDNIDLAVYSRIGYSHGSYRRSAISSSFHYAYDASVFRVLHEKHSELVDDLKVAKIIEEFYTLKSTFGSKLSKLRSDFKNAVEIPTEMCTIRKQRLANKWGFTVNHFKMVDIYVKISDIDVYNYTPSDTMDSNSLLLSIGVEGVGEIIDIAITASVRNAEKHNALRSSHTNTKYFLTFEPYEHINDYIIGRNEIISWFDYALELLKDKYITEFFFNSIGRKDSLI